MIECSSETGYSRQQSVCNSGVKGNDQARVRARERENVNEGGNHNALNADVKNAGADGVVLELREVVEDCVVPIRNVEVVPA